MMNRIIILYVFLLPTLLLAQDSFKPSSGVPIPLQPWVNWVESQHPEWRCAQVGNEPVCVWPGSAKLELRNNGGSFELNAELLRKSQVALPYQKGIQPYDLKVVDRVRGETTPALIVDNNKASLLLDAGSYMISGLLAWDTLPPEIPVPMEYGILSVSLASDIEKLRIERTTNTIKLEPEINTTTSDGLNINIYRRLVDGSPLRIDTRIVLRVSGAARSLELGSVLLPGSLPVNVHATLSYQFDSAGRLSLELTPGEHTVSIESVMEQPVLRLTRPNNFIKEWPIEELWSWVEDAAFRSVELRGISAVQAELTTMPIDWQGGAAYAVPSGAEASLLEIRRGEQSTQAQALILNREMWLDLDGGGFTVRDKIKGRISGSYRLNALDELKIGRAIVNGAPWFISKDPNSERSGLDLRESDVEIEAVSILDGTRTFSAVGYDTDLSQLNISLHLPPLARLFNVSGARAPSSWIEAWTLLGIFGCLLLIVATNRILGRKVAIIIGVLIPLSHQEFLVPRMLFIHLLIVVLWYTLVTDKNSVWGAISRSLIYVTFIAWCLEALAFAKLQFSQFLYPQLEAGSRYRTAIQEIAIALERSFLAWPLILLLLALAILSLSWIFNYKSTWQLVKRSAAVLVLGVVVFSFVGGYLFSILIENKGPRRTVASSKAYTPEEGLQSRKLYKEYESNSIGKTVALMDLNEPAALPTYEQKKLLTGPAIPSWNWRTHNIWLKGPVLADSQIGVSFLSPGFVRFLSGLRAALTLYLIMLVFRRIGFSFNLPLRGLATSAALILILILLPHNAAAQFPDQDLLKSLEARMSAERCTLPDCAAIESATISIVDDRIEISMIGYSNGRAAINIPGPYSSFAPTAVRINGRPSVALRRNSSDFIQARTENGRNTIEVSGTAPANSFTLQFPSKPLHLNVEARNWISEGISAGGTTDGTVRFTRKRSDKVENRKASAAVLPGWIIAKRRFLIGEDISISTQLERLGDVSHSRQLRLPLLRGEQVTSAGFSAENGELVVNFKPAEKFLNFNSLLPYKAELKLESQKGRSLSEIWEVACKPIVSCSASGLKPTSSASEGQREWHFDPFPGELTTIKVRALDSVGGDFVTIDEVTSRQEFGAYMRSADLSITVRVSEQAPFWFELPEGAVVKGATLDGKGAISIEGRKLSALLSPGSHELKASYTEGDKAGIFDRVSAVTFSHPAHNVKVQISPTDERWLLFTGGTSWGPSVVFWGKLIMVILIVLGLSNVGLLTLTPLASLFLGIGLTTLPMIRIWIPLTWLAALALYAAQRQIFKSIPRNIFLVGFALLTVLSLACIYEVIEYGLVLTPPMLVVGGQSTAASLNWYLDHGGTVLFRPWIIWLPLWTWRLLMLVWSTWMVVMIIKWIKQSIEIVRVKV